MCYDAGKRNKEITILARLVPASPAHILIWTISSLLYADDLHHMVFISFHHCLFDFKSYLCVVKCKTGNYIYDHCSGLGRVHYTQLQLPKWYVPCVA